MCICLIESQNTYSKIYRIKKRNKQIKDFNAILLVIDRTSKHKISKLYLQYTYIKYTEDLNNATNQLT